MFLHPHLRLPPGNNLVVSPMPHQGSFMRPQNKKWDRVSLTGTQHGCKKLSFPLPVSNYLGGLNADPVKSTNNAMV